MVSEIRNGLVRATASVEEDLRKTAAAIQQKAHGGAEPLTAAEARINAVNVAIRDFMPLPTAPVVRGS